MKFNGKRMDGGYERDTRRKERLQSILRTGRRPWLVPLVCLLAVLAVIVGAFIVSSVTERHLKLDDGTVWVTSLNDGKAARFNVALQEPDVAVMASGAQFDVAQAGAVTMLDEDASTASIDQATVSMADTTPTKNGIRTYVGGDTVAMFDTQRGSVWIGDASDVKSIRPVDSDPTMKLGVGGKIAVTHDGTVYGYRPRDAKVLAVNPASSMEPREVTQLADGAQSADSFTVVGDHPVISSGDRLIWDKDGSAEFEDAGPLTLQAPSVDGEQDDWVAAGAQSGLALVDLSAKNGDPLLLSSGAKGEPAQPVSLGGCVQGAWAQQAHNAIKVCSADSDAQFTTLEEITPTSQLVYRVNHRRAVLNDVLNGNLWNPDVDTSVIKIQWKKIETKQESREQNNDESTNSKRNFEKQCSSQSGQIKAADDEFGARVGSHQILDVLRNDEQTDCSVLRITSVSAPKNSSITVSPIYDGRYLQLNASDASTGTASFTYEISDGRDQTSSATVTLKFESNSGNHAPRQTETPEQIDVEQGASYTGNALGGFVDEDGDPLTLVDAHVENTEEATVSTRADGQLTFNAGSMNSGRATVKLTVSDGKETATGTMYFAVRPAHTLPASIDPVVKRTTPNTATQIDLKPYVHGTSVDPVKISDVEAPDKTTASPHPSDVGFTFTAQQTGTYYVSYTATQGTIPATGLVRVEVEALTKDESRPVAANDVALLGADNTAIVEPLTNDVDPLGGVLSVTDVRAPADSSIKAGIVSNKRVYLTAMQLPTAPVEIEYTVANAAGSSTGTIVLQPPALSGASSAPKASNVDVSVRTGGIVSVDVPDHVTYADGTTITLSNKLQYDASTFKGLVFVASDIVRYQAPGEPGSYPVTYTVTDTLGNSASATITFNVHRADAEAKSAASPKDVEAQVAAGQKIRIPITLRGIDNDGDDVQLLGLGNTVPQLGRISEVGADYLVYEAYEDSSGTDEFSYAVEDWTGRRAQANVRVGIFKSGANSSVYARDDTVTLRPNTATTVPVLLNDVASDDSKLTVVKELEAQGVVDAKVTNDMVSFTTPSTAGTGYIVYTIKNKAGLTDRATLTVNVDPKAPIEPPTAYDYHVPAIATIDKRSVDVDVSKFIANPSGSSDVLAVNVDESARDHAHIASGKKTTISIDLTDEARAVPYTVTNTEHDITSTAFIMVPAYGVFPPQLRPKAPPLNVNAGSSITINIADYVRVGVGKTAVVEKDSVSATKAANNDLYVNDQTLKFTAAKNYGGPASITFTVTDGKREGKGNVKIVNSSVITLPITVIGHEMPAPTFSSTTVDVVAGESPTTIDLRALTHTTESDEDAKFRYSGGTTSGGITASVDADGKLTVSAETTAKPGATASIPITIAYGSNGGVVQAGLTARVTASTRPLARVNGTTTRIKAGETKTVDVLADAYNPFPDSPLKIVSAASNDGGKLSVSVDGSRISVTAAKDIGASSTRVLVTIGDATGSADRQVTATYTFSVVDRPDAPIIHNKAESQDGAVIVSWTPGNANGSPITAYEVSWKDGKKLCDPGSSCLISGLKNGTEYTFTVRAQNEVGWSESSDTANGKPDKTPDAPQDVRVIGGYQKLHVSWSAPKDTASAPKSYTVTVNGTPRPSEGLKTELDIPLDNSAIGDGTFSVTVTATNEVGTGTPSEPKTNADKVYGDPEAPSVVAKQTAEDKIVLTATVNNTRNAGCSTITFGSYGSVDCSGKTVEKQIHIEDDNMYFKDFSVTATINPEKPGAKPSTSAPSAPIPITVNIGAVTITKLEGSGKVCTVAWESTGRVKEVKLDFGSASGMKEPRGSATTDINPWDTCPPAEVTPYFMNKPGDKKDSKHNTEYKYKVNPHIDQGKFWLEWDRTDPNKIHVHNDGAVDAYTQDYTYELTVPGAPQAYTQKDTVEVQASDSTPKDARWNLKVTMAEDQNFTASIDGQVRGIRATKPAPTPDPSPSPSEPEPSPSPSESGEAQPSAFRQRALRPYGQLVAVPGSRSMVFL